MAAGLLLVASPIIVPLALLSEASRFDGWGDLSMSQELQLYRRNSIGGVNIRRRALRDLTREDAHWADGANIPRAFGGRRYRETPAPLHRRGFGSSLEFSGAGTPALSATDHGLQIGLGLRTSFSYFPHPLVGFLAVLDWSRLNQSNLWGRDSRTGLELQLFAPGISEVHFGAFALAGRARSRRIHEGTTTIVRGAYVEVGGIVQVELATRLAVQARGGVWVFGGDLYPAFALGLSIY